MGRYKGLGMPKAKKKRVKPVDFAKIVKEVEPPLAGGEGGAASTRKLREPPAAPQPSSAPPSPGAADRQLAQDLLERWALKFEELKAKEAAAAWKAKLAEKLCDAKMRRMDAPKHRRGQRKLKNPLAQVCRRYEALIELSNWQRLHTARIADAARAQNYVLGCMNQLKRLEIVRLHRHAAAYGFVE